MRIKNLLILMFLTFLSVLVIAETAQNKPADNTIRILTWDGYVTQGDIQEVNKILKKEGYTYNVEVISPLADNPEQMFNAIRGNKCEVVFLTLYFIKLQHEKVTSFIQPINTNSPRLTNYKYLYKNLINIPMGMKEGGKCLYIPFGGGAYGFWADMNKIKPADVPKTMKDLLDVKWKGKFSLNVSQPYYNVAISSMILERQPFEINDLVVAGKRSEAIKFNRPDNEVMKTLTALYANAGNYWTAGPEFKDNLQIITSWGPEMIKANEKGGNWKMINFKEGNLVWLDTINFTKSLSGKKLEAAEIFANYFIGKRVQDRVVKDLSMVAVSTIVDENPIIEANPNFFDNKLFIPPFEQIADNIMQQMSEEALKDFENK